MTFPIAIESHNGTFTASLLGSTSLRAEGATRDQALERLRAFILQRVQRGELVLLDINLPGVSGTAGLFADDPTLRDICEEIYRARDAEVAE